LIFIVVKKPRTIVREDGGEAQLVFLKVCNSWRPIREDEPPPLLLEIHQKNLEISDWLSGDRNFTIDTLFDIGQVLGIDFLGTSLQLSNQLVIPKSIGV